MDIVELIKAVKAAKDCGLTPIKKGEAIIVLDGKAYPITAKEARIVKKFYKDRPRLAALRVKYSAYVDLIQELEDKADKLKARIKKLDPSFW